MPGGPVGRGGSRCGRMWTASTRQTRGGCPTPSPSSRCSTRRCGFIIIISSSSSSINVSISYISYMKRCPMPLPHRSTYFEGSRRPIIIKIIIIYNKIIIIYNNNLKYNTRIVCPPDGLLTPPPLRPSPSMLAACQHGHTCICVWNTMPTFIRRQDVIT